MHPWTQKTSNIDPWVLRVGISCFLGFFCGPVEHKLNMASLEFGAQLSVVLVTQTRLCEGRLLRDIQPEQMKSHWMAVMILRNLWGSLCWPIIQNKLDQGTPS